MDRSRLIVSLVALLIGLILGAAALSRWEGGRQRADLDTLKVELADERGQVEAKVKQLTDELSSEKQRQAPRGPRARAPGLPGSAPHRGGQGAGRRRPRCPRPLRGHRPRLLRLPACSPGGHAGPRQEVFDDLPNFTDSTLQVQISELVA